MTSRISSILRLSMTVLFCIAVMACGGSSESTNGSEPNENNATGNNSGPQQFSPSADLGQNGSEFYLSANNSSLLAGSMFGLNTRNNDQIRKSLSVENSEYQDFVIRDAYALNYNETNSSVVIVIQNTSTQARCLAELENIVVRDVQGSLSLGGVTNVVPARVFGSVGLVDDFYTNSCLAPTETGYVTVPGTFDFERVANIAIGEITSVEGNIAPESLRVVPVGFTIEGQEIEIQIQNQSSDTVMLSFDFQTVALDELGLPLWVSLDLLNDEKILGPGVIATATQSIARPRNEFSGEASTLRSMVTFSQPVDLSFTVIGTLIGTVSFTYQPQGSFQSQTETVVFTEGDIEVGPTGDIGLRRTNEQGTFTCEIGQSFDQPFDCAIENPAASGGTTTVFRFSLGGDFPNLSGNGSAIFCTSDSGSLDESTLQDCIATLANNPDGEVMVQVTKL